MTASTAAYYEIRHHQPPHTFLSLFRIRMPYQVDFRNEASGKRWAASKRRVRWRLGLETIPGQKGPDARGSEHEVVLVWSLASGKRLVLWDGEQVHFSVASWSETQLDVSWTMGGHWLQLVAYATAPLVHVPGFRQFDLFLDGMSFFDMPRIYQLGDEQPRLQLQSEPYNVPPSPADAPKPLVRKDSPAPFEDLLLPPVKVVDLLDTEHYAPAPTYESLHQEIWSSPWGYETVQPSVTPASVSSTESDTYYYSHHEYHSPPYSASAQRNLFASSAGAW